MAGIRTVRVKDELWFAAKAAADQEGTTFSAFVRSALQDRIGRRAKMAVWYYSCPRCGQMTLTDHDRMVVVCENGAHPGETMDLQGTGAVMLDEEPPS